MGLVIRKPIESMEQWAIDRRKYIGASEVPIVAGVDGRFASKAILFAEKKGLRPPQTDNAAMRRGRLGEGACLEALCEEHPDWQVARAKVHVIDEDHRLACTPDAAAVRPDYDGVGIVQCKVIARSMWRQKWLDEPDGSIHGPASAPPAYYLQTLTEMMLNETQWGVLAVLIVGEYEWLFRLIDVERNAAIEDRIIFDVDFFWREYLDPGIMPPLEPERDEVLIKHLYPKDNGSTVDLTGDNRALALVEDLAETKAGLKRLRDAETALTVELQAKLGDHTYGILADGRAVSWKAHHRKAYSVNATDYRVLRVLKHAPHKESDDD